MAETGIVKLVDIQKALMARESRFIEAIGADSPERYKRFKQNVITYWMMNESMRQCTVESYIKACFQMAAQGLNPNANECYVIKYGNVATYMPSYIGLKTLAYRHPDVESVEMRVVYEGDEFDFEYGTDPYIRHKTVLENEDPAKITHAYAIAIVNGKPIFQVVGKGFVQARMNANQVIKKYGKAKSLLWNNYAEQGWMKTAFKQLVKMIPTTTELQEAVRIDDLHTIGKPNDAERVISLPDSEVTELGNYDQIDLEDGTQTQGEKLKTALKKKGVGKKEGGKEKNLNLPDDNNEVENEEIDAELQGLSLE